MDRVVIEQVSAGRLLAELRACDHTERQAGARRLLIATEWVTLHPVIQAVPAELRRCLVDEQLNLGMDAIAEFAAAHGVSTGAGRDLLVDAVELRSRLPRCWQLVQELTIPAWKGRLVAAASRDLGDEAAAFLDGQAALLAGKLTARAINRLALVALARYEPDRIVDPNTRRWITVAADRLNVDGAGWIDGRLDVPDALDLEAAIRTIAADLAAHGCTDTLDVRRAHAVGVLARRALGQPPLIGPGQPVGQDGSEPWANDAHTQPAPASSTPAAAGVPVGQPNSDESHDSQPSATHHRHTAVTDGRAITLYVHLSADQLQCNNHAGDSRGASVSRLAELGTTGQLVTVEQVRHWCGTAGAITVRPVIDLNTDRSVRGYHPTDLQRQHIALRDHTCTFPHCSRPARPIPTPSTGKFTTDADHIVPYTAGGDTTTTNLACLCRTHHLLKTHTHWTYEAIGPAEYLWRSPHGHHYLRTTTGTTPLPPPPSTTDQPAA